ncbi:MAG: hypothetical protein QF749_12705 [Verrucomicrobiota bacterium]|nr:hypothetical protein [Verrucomicrobiota bacterium]MDP7179143.1 hypothetical protein [Verrucomicrobiota bacterium]MDP7442475.1 hypothetical protein [Verrucomicrobiota bacterium]HJN82136.1 hypothetical protein [Verrucomicrobiota bacterium]
MRAVIRPFMGGEYRGVFGRCRALGQAAGLTRLGVNPTLASLWPSLFPAARIPDF